MQINLKKLSLKDLQALMYEQGTDIYPQLIDILAADPRGGARRLLRLLRERQAEAAKERERLTRLQAYEHQIWAMGYRRIAGLDEAGRDPLAGPVVAAAVVFDREVDIPGLEGFRRLPERRRREVYAIIAEKALAIGIGTVQPEGSDEPNLLLATYRALHAALAALTPPPDYLLVDTYNLPGVHQPQATIVGGESVSSSIAAAAVVAKVLRDQHMINMDKLYPEYGFARNKGYGTAEHRAALARYGPSPIHRRNGDGSVPDTAVLPGNWLAED